MDGNESDRRIQRKVEDKLASEFLIDESQIEVEVADEVVTLVGTVGSYAERLIAQHAAQSAPGVRDLVVAIDVKPPVEMHPTDEDLAQMIEQILAWDALVPERNLIVSVTDGLVALTGTCPTQAQAREAERAVSHLGGVRGLLNRIVVETPTPTPTQVRAAIADALQRRAAHQAAHLDVVVDGPRVTLRGELSSAGERQAVIGAVGHAPGVDEVRSEIRISDDHTVDAEGTPSP